MKEYKGYNYSQEGETYIIYNKDSEPWIVGFKTEERVKAQIDDLVNQGENANNEKAELESLKEQVTNLELALAEIVEGGLING